MRQREGGQRRRLAAQDAGAERRGGESGGEEGPFLRLGPSPLGADGEEHAGGLGRDVEGGGLPLAARRNRRLPGRRGRKAPGEGGGGEGGVDAGDAPAFALFGGGEEAFAPAVELRLGPVPGAGHAVLREERQDPGGAELHGFFEEPFPPLAFDEGGKEPQVAAGLSGGEGGQAGHPDLRGRRARDGPLPAASRAVEEEHPFPFARPQDPRQMAGLLAAHRGGTGGFVDVFGQKLGQELPRCMSRRV